jgi:mono/diheme cytochrome c family protein
MMSLRVSDTHCLSPLSCMRGGGGKLSIRQCELTPPERRAPASARLRAGVRVKLRMLQCLFAACASLTLTFIPLNTQAQTTTTEPLTQATIDAGKKLYTSYCARCHGLNMVNTGSSFDLRTFPTYAKERFESSVKEGIKAMPAWGNTFSADELAALWSYVSARP